MEEVRLFYFDGVKKFKSSNRAIKRGHMSTIGSIYPNRPFNNRKNKDFQDLKRKIYEEWKTKSR